MYARGVRPGGPRRWGGVVAAAAVCALVPAVALLPPAGARTADGADGADAGGAGNAGGAAAVRGAQARAEDDCTAPEKRTLAPSSADGDTIRAIRNRAGGKRKLVVGVDQNSYRWGYRDPNGGPSGKLEGFDIDLVHRIAEDILGDPDAVQFKAIPTDQRIPAIRQGRVDMVVRTMTISCRRLEEVAFSAPYFRTGQQVLAPKSSDVTGYDDTLAGKRICTAQGSTANGTLVEDRRTGGLPASADLSTTVPNQLDCLVRLQLGEVDAVVTDGALAASQAAQDPTVELKGEPFTTDYYGVAMRKDADDLVRRVNRILTRYREDDANGWQASYDRWLSATLGKDAARSRPPAPQYLRGS
ncbi:glutamate ABC transporter substrate-binding protein [Streptomyces sp. NPDC052701]|uniref:glutamate ABC transporter substrate-binding protein n=1 Tax=Streptomyces sp. NPDC052701 TaxID=3155533 RepID=UPI003443368C